MSAAELIAGAGPRGAGPPVLAIRPRAFGDVILTTAALRALRRGYPDAPLELVTERRYAALMAAQPELSGVWALEPGARATLALARVLRARPHRAVVDFFGNPRSAQLTAAARTPLRAGYDLRGRGGVYSVRVARTLTAPDGTREYAGATHVRLAVAAGGVADGSEPRLTVPESARRAGEELLEQSGLLTPGRAVGLVPAGTWPTKTWPVSHYAVLARELIAAGRPVLLVAGPGEAGIAGAIARLAPGAAVLPPGGPAALAAALARLALVAGTDSGPRHLAAALGVPSFAWFGPTHPQNWNPPGASHGHWFADVPCRGCDRTECPHWVCMTRLAPRDAARLLLDHLERHAAADLRPAAGA